MSSTPCADDPELFFSEHPHDVELAQRICGRCPERAALACLVKGIPEEFGIWAGTTPEDRAKLAQEATPA